jgi:ClpP class serine protease
MKLPALLATLTSEPLLLTPGAQAAYLRLLEATHVERALNRELMQREGVGMSGDAVEVDQAEMRDGLLYVPVGGPIGRGLDKFEKGAGAVDVQDIEDELDGAEEDPECRGVIMIFDTPGGMYSGTPELSDRIEAFDKPVLGWIPGACCSAGLWLAASCDGIFAAKSADIGCVGVYCYLLDQSKRYADAGVKPIVVSSGIYKGMGAPGTSFSPEQLAHLQERVDQMAAEFFAHIQRTRPDVQMADMQGQTFKPSIAREKGFIDDVLTSVEDVAALLG